MNKLLFPLLISLMPFLASAQEKEELIEWSSHKRLTWSDYKGRADASSGAAASTATYLGIDYNFGPQGFSYKINCSFSKTKSWGLHKNEYILGHEQGHFDIAEIFARKLHSKMKNYKFDKNNYKSDLKKIYEEVLDEKEEMQNKYDQETNHSIIKDKQSEWLKKIQKLLEEYKAYSGYS
jgi:hypothetical protein